MLSPFLFAVVVDVVTRFAREGALSESLFADDLFLVSETIMGLRNKLLRKEAFESKGLKVNLGKTKVMVCGGITKDCNKIGSCGVCSLREKANSVLCVQCGNWIHGRCARMKSVTSKFLENFCMQKM